MPKDASSRHKSRYHPYATRARGESCSNEADDSPKEWEDATCPICMEFPHNAVLLVCTSHDNGCRPYVCDTSYRHSNCFDQYRKSSRGQQSSNREVVIHEPLSASGGSSARTRERSAVRMRPLRELLENATSPTENAPGRAIRELGLEERDMDLENFFHVLARGSTQQQQQHQQQPQHLHQHQQQQQQQQQEQQQQQQQQQQQGQQGQQGQVDTSVLGTCSIGEDTADLMCPLCRGKVIGWKVVEAARKHLNGKTRNCAQEACAFVGSYDELRKHARCTHPFARPADVDPARQRDWRHLERERDIGDVLSTIQSAMPGARILGDYVIDEDNEEQDEEAEDNDFSGDEGNWWTVFLLFQVFGPVAHGAGAGSIPTRLRGLSRGHHHLSRLALPSSRQALWGEDIQVNQVEVNGAAVPDAQNEQAPAAPPAAAAAASAATSEDNTSTPPVEAARAPVPTTRRSSRRRRSRHQQ